MEWAAEQLCMLHAFEDDGKPFLTAKELNLSNNASISMAVFHEAMFTDMMLNLLIYFRAFKEPYFVLSVDIHLI